MKNKKKLGTFIAFSVILLSFLLGEKQLTESDTKQAVENMHLSTPSIVEPVDQCDLKTVKCLGEEEAESAAVAPVFNDPCAFGPYAPDCTVEAFDAIVVENKIIEAAQAYGIRVEDALSIAECESTFNSRAQNPHSTAKGVYQFTDPTWKWIKAQGHQFDVDENIKMFMIFYPIYPNWWGECIYKS